MSESRAQKALLQDAEFCRLLTSHMVDVFVGPKRRAFHLHRDLLCDRSPYFKSAFLGAFVEAKTKELFLPEDHASAFENFVNWLYGATLKKPVTETELSSCLRLLVLSEKLMLEYLRNLCTDFIRQYYHDTHALVRAEDLSFVYESVQSEPLRSFLVALLAFQTMKANQISRDVAVAFLPGYRELMACGGAFAVDFLWFFIGIAVGVDNTMAKRLLERDSSCWFHFHDSTRNCKGHTGNRVKSAEEYERSRRQPLPSSVDLS